MSALRNLAARVGLLVRDDSADDLAGFGPRLTIRDRSIDAEAAALSLDAVYRAVLVLQTSASQLTLDAWRGAAPLEPRPALLDRPDVFSTRPAFLAETIGSLACRGNAYWKHHTNPAGAVTGLSVLDPLTVAPLGRGRFMVGGAEQTGGISHLQLMRRPGRLEGLGPIQACAETIHGAVEMRRWADRWLTDGGVPTGVLTSDQVLDKATAERYKKQFNEATSHADGVAVLGAGLSYAPLSLKPSEIQFLETQRANVTSVARMFGMPARLMLAAVDGGSDTYANLEAEHISYVRFTLMRYLNEIETALSDLLPRGQLARFNIDGLLRTDTKTRYQAHKIGIDAGFLDAEEVRVIEGLTPRSREDA